MEPLIALVAVTLATYAWRRDLPLAVRAGVTAMFLLTGVVHFVGMRQELIDMVPPALPNPGLLVTISGILEIAGAVGLWFDRLRLPAAGGLFLTLFALFPANVQLALSGEDIPWHDQLLPRTLLQIVFLTATGYLTWVEIRGRRTGRPSAGAGTGSGRTLTDARL
ncbi:DoxX family protein [Knoellia subterranea]|uniref:DoxX family protein n=1 Tax=Knoellia subterranea KCTC 19937 TaxID=1385521 RepID=A0A0A0JK76_9MICO|nr:DoxX family membrane protein [Knoellia subterranea]KGN37840.1 hypothetical protein N803_12330 [Knoellia subterranea KCTC 19937]